MKTTLLAALLLSGCCAMIPDTQLVTVTCGDSEAELFADGMMIGKGSSSFAAARNRDHVFMAKSEDGAIGYVQVSTIGNPLVLLDIAGAILWIVPVVGLLTPGAWMLDSTAVIIPLDGSASVLPAEETQPEPEERERRRWPSKSEADRNETDAEMLDVG